MNKKLEEVNKIKANLQIKLEDKNRDKIPEKVRADQDAQWQKLQEEERVILDAITKIK